MLSGAMMLSFWAGAKRPKLIEDGIARTIQQKKVTYDLERMMPGATKVSTSAFASAIIENMKGMAALDSCSSQDCHSEPPQAGEESVLTVEIQCSTLSESKRQ